MALMEQSISLLVTDYQKAEPGKLTAYFGKQHMNNRVEIYSPNFRG